jgi:hypothetical protein
MIRDGVNPPERSHLDFLLVEEYHCYYWDWDGVVLQDSVQPETLAQFGSGLGVPVLRGGGQGHGSTLARISWIGATVM